MKTKKCSVYYFKRILKRKRIICYGAGQAFISFCNNYQHFGLIDNLKYVVDNNPQKQNGTLDILGKQIIVRSYKYLLTHISEEDVIFITNRKYADEISTQIEKEPILKDIPSYFIPEEISWVNKIMWGISSVLPLRNTLVFQGPDEFCDNGYAIRDHMIRTGIGKKYKFVWNVDSTSDFQNSKNQIYIKRNGYKYSDSIMDRWRYIYYFSTAKYIFYESAPLKKVRRKQNLVFLGHGAFSLKKSQGIIVTSQDVDYVICPSENCVEGICEQTRSSPEQMLICGCPRNDILFSTKSVIERVLGKREHTKVIVWMPTLRQSNWSERKDSKKIYPFGIPLISNCEELQQLQRLLKKHSICLLIKPHPFQDISRFGNINTTNEIKIVVNNELKQKKIDLYDILKDTDALISDYSSVSFDYMLLDKPIAYTIDDMDEYSLGFAMDNPLEFMPGHHLKTYDDLIQFICDFENDVYRDKRNKICDFIHKYRDGNNTKRLLKKIGVKD